MEEQNRQSELRREVIEAGLRLQLEGLVARTWGNISVRLSDTHFLITPSGIGYDRLSEEDLVEVAIADCSYDSEIKPSSEKGIHADVYRLRPEIHMVVHTHQFYASCLGVSGADLDEPYTPCADYGLPSTEKLRDAVACEVENHPNCRSFLMRNHGALIIGESSEETFERALKLEDDCRRIWETEVRNHPAPEAVGRELPASVTDALKKHYPGKAVLFVQNENLLYAAQNPEILHPVLDDLAQIGGTGIPVVYPIASSAAEAMRGRNAVLIKGYGAVCLADTPEDAQAVGMILTKDCAAARYTGSRRGLSGIDALLQRQIYIRKYAKRNREKNSGE